MDQGQRIPKSISNQNLFSAFQSWCWTTVQKKKKKKKPSIDPAMLGGYFKQKNQRVWLVERMLGPKAKNQTDKPLGITQSTCSFHGSTCKKISIIAPFTLDMLQI